MSRTASRTVTGDRRPPSRGDQQRARIIEAVTTLLGDVPITDLSVMQVAKLAGVTRPVFYFYFESKYAAVAAALEQAWLEFDAARSSPAGIADLSRDPSAITRQLIDDAVTIWRRHHGLLNACVLARTADPQLDAMWRTFVQTQTHRIIALFNGLRGRVRIRPTSDDLPGLIDALLGMTVWALVEESTETDAANSDRRIASITAIWLAAIWAR